ncbi:protein-tyrosine kinase 6b [Eucyclogobius newberryi]|uniref:protein-tyrosine kinase 6b n=1 Tax=Eucyclogobius newberryi TaxID=166745 RepID=UPI003B5BA4CA
MDDCMRRVCPCLVALWDRLRGEKKPGDGSSAPGNAAVTPPPKTITPTPSAERSAEPGTMYVAMWTFEARNEDEMSFRTGDLFNVLSRGGDWWKARRIDKNGRVLGTGIVPCNYLERAESLATQGWYFGTMNRFEAQGHLMGPDNETGAFMIRQSDKESVGYVLSVRSSMRVKHFKVMKDSSDQFHIEPSPHFPSLFDLVEHYSNCSLSNAGTLGKPCKRKKPKPTEQDLNEWELPRSEFTLEEELGSGFFSDVYRGRWKNHISVAIKILKNDSELNHQEFVREVEILKRLRHRHLISLFAVCTESAPYYIVTELMEKGSLLHVLRGPEGKHQDTVSLVDMGAQVADGMTYLEENNCIHRDLAARNVLVGDGYICKVADFGLGRVIKEPFYVTEDKKIPYKWSAPEAISHGKFSSKSDVWSFGVLLYEIITCGGNPYPAFNNTEVFEHVTKGYRMPCPLKCPEFLYQIMTDCWDAEPASRPTFRSLKQRLDNSIASYEWEEKDMN